MVNGPVPLLGLRIFDSTPGYVATELAERNMPLFEQRRLIFRKVFVEKIQAAASWRTFRAAFRPG